MIGLFATSCSQDDDLQGGSMGENTQPQKIRWYGVKNADAPETRGVADGVKLWNSNVGITVKFLNTPSDASKIEKVKEIAREWEQYAGIKFNFVEADQNAGVRIAFDWKGNDYLTWSYTGSDARFEKDQSQPTAVISGMEYLSEQEYRGDILRVFGQILGLEYEQRHQDWAGFRTEAALESYWRAQFGDIEMDWNELREYVFTPLTQETGVNSILTPQIDEQSIMAWPYYSRTESMKLLSNTELSEQDKIFITSLYPKDGWEIPANERTIQRAWVETGYFRWLDDAKTKLAITYKGSQQEYLPDVIDGSQLTEIQFHYLVDGVLNDPNYDPNNYPLYGNNNDALKKVPYFDSSNITNFSSMFTNFRAITSVPKLDTSSGTNFGGPSSWIQSSYVYGMFSGCVSLKEVPDLDTSKGTNFIGMFLGCASLEKAPFLQTSNGLAFGAMFRDCTSLKEVPLYDTSKGTDFTGMFIYCKSLKSVPDFNTSNGLFFGNDHYPSYFGMFYGCTSLEVRPNLDLSNAIDTTGMYYYTPAANNPI